LGYPLHNPHCLNKSWDLLNIIKPEKKKKLNNHTHIVYNMSMVVKLLFFISINKIEQIP
jgi:hypothetical protein